MTQICASCFNVEGFDLNPKGKCLMGRDLHVLVEAHVEECPFIRRTPAGLVRPKARWDADQQCDSDRHHYGDPERRHYGTPDTSTCLLPPGVEF